MKPTFTLALSAALALWPLTLAHGAPKTKTESPSAEAESVLARIDAAVAEVSDAAFQLNAQTARDPELHLDGLQTLKTDLNWIGSELKTLDGERGSLAEWEQKALDAITPLLHDAAENTDKAIQTFNSDRQHLFATSYADDTAKVVSDADKVSALLRDSLKLEKVREHESNLERTLAGEAQF